jgi:hypothetical protein
MVTEVLGAIAFFGLNLVQVHRELAVGANHVTDNRLAVPDYYITITTL